MPSRKEKEDRNPQTGMDVSVNLATVPEGFDVDHIKGLNIENPDGIDNLRLLPLAVNRTRRLSDEPTEEPEYPDFVTEEVF